MYNLAKLLTDEPHKLERLIFLFLKLLITLHVTGLIFGLDLSVGSIIENPVPKTASAIQIIYFFVVVVAAWFVLWNVIAEFLFYDILVGLLSSIGNGRGVFVGTMAVLGVASEEKNGRLAPKRNIIPFADSLAEFHDDETIEESHTRVKQYYMLTVVAYTTLLISTKSVHLSKAEIIIGAILIANLFVGCIAINKFIRYMTDNLEALQRELQPLAYGQKIMNAISEIKKFEAFNPPHRGRKIVLQRKPGFDSAPEKVKILPAYHWNESLGKRLLLQMIQARGQKNLSPGSYDIVLTNIPRTEDIEQEARRQENLALIFAKDEDEIFFGLEEWIYLVANRRKQQPAIEDGASA